MLDQEAVQDCYVVAKITQDGDPQFDQLDELAVLALSTVLFFVTVCWSTFDSHIPRGSKSLPNHHLSQ